MAWWKRMTVPGVIASMLVPVSSTMAYEQQTIHLQAFVPVYCNIDLQMTSMMSEPGVVSLGQSMELCNAPRGYRIILEHAANLHETTLISDSLRIPLSATGETVLVNSDYPNLQIRQLALDLGDEPETIGRLGLRIEVKY